MNKQHQIERLNEAFSTLKYNIESSLHIPMENEDAQLTSVIENLERMAYHAIRAITPMEITMEKIPKINFIKSKKCTKCHGSGIKIDDSERIGHQIQDCYSCNHTGRII